jgi:hypothetical protein
MKREGGKFIGIERIVGYIIFSTSTNHIYFPSEGV